MAYHTIMRAWLILDTKTVLTDGRIIQRKVWQIPATLVARHHGLKYSLYCGRDGKTIVRYDNETGKGDHRHVGPDETESAYRFVSLQTLLQDFAKDIESFSGEME